MCESVCSRRLGDSGWRGSGRAVAIDDHIATVKISNKKYDCRPEDCLPVGTEFTKLNANWAEVTEQEEEIQTTTHITKSTKAKNKELDLLKEFNAYEEKDVNTQHSHHQAEGVYNAHYVGDW